MLLSAMLYMLKQYFCQLSSWSSAVTNHGLTDWQFSYILKYTRDTHLKHANNYTGISVSSYSGCNVRAEIHRHTFIPNLDAHDYKIFNFGFRVEHCFCSFTAAWQLAWWPASAVALTPIGNGKKYMPLFYTSRFACCYPKSSSFTRNKTRLWPVASTTY